MCSKSTDEVLINIMKEIQAKAREIQTMLREYERKQSNNLPVERS